MGEGFWSDLVVPALVLALAVAGGVGYAVRRARRITRSLAARDAQAGELAALQAALRERDRSLAAAREALAAAEALNRAKDEFLALLGHELRDPLAAISSAAQIVKSERHTPQQLEFAAAVIERQSRHLKRLIDDLLDVERVMTGKIRLERAPLELAATAQRVATALEISGRLAGRRVELDLSPAWVDGDSTRLEEVVSNLMVNAAACTPPGGHIRVRVAPEGEHVVLQVSDDGEGSAVDRPTGGLGIGLLLVKRLVELHGGTVQAASGGRGKGSTLTVRVPGTTAREAAVSDAVLRPPAQRTILLVEDNADARDSLKTLLELQGHRVITAPDGLIGLELLKRHRPPLAIVDIGLPGLDGYRFAIAARGELGEALRLIALTGYGGRADERRARDAGFDVHLAKPVDMGELASALDDGGAPRSRAA